MVKFENLSIIYFLLYRNTYKFNHHIKRPKFINIVKKTDIEKWNDGSVKNDIEVKNKKRLISKRQSLFNNTVCIKMYFHKIKFRAQIQHFTSTKAWLLFHKN